MRLDTEDKIATEIGADVRGPGAPYNGACIAGMTAYLDDPDCAGAWRRFGCTGTDRPRM